MKLKKSQLETLFLVLKGTENILSLADARIRDKVMKSIGKEYEVFGLEKTEIFKKYCMKNEDDSLDAQTDEKGQTVYHFTNEDGLEVNKEIEILFNEEVEIETTDKLKEFIEKSEYNPKFGQAEIIDDILTKC